MDADGPPRITPRKLVTAVLSLLVVAAILLWVLPWATGADWSGILATIGSLPWWAMPAVTVLGLAAVALEAITVRVAVPGSRCGAVLQGHAASSGISLAIPGGGLLGIGMLAWLLRRRGLALAVVITGLIAASLVEMAVTSVMVPVLGLGAYALSSLLAGSEIDLPGAGWAAVVALAVSVLALALTALGLNRRVLSGLLAQAGAIPGFPAPELVLAQRDALLHLLRTRALALLGPTAGARIVQWAALLVALAAVDLQVPLLLTIAIFALGRVLSLIPLTPGGAAITETVAAAALVALGYGAEDAAAAMLLLAVATVVVPLLTGALGAATALQSPPAQSPPRHSPPEESAGYSSST
ncbi:MAG TPA: flippase-like domain-containing protein [Candidatus Brachybacterium merdigallinarum]|nr:flippase-like domain-containing protein [Candidatus Brachybacterium merdigallinarum]